MHVQPVLGLIAQPAQPGNPRLRGEIQFRRVLNAQHHRLSRHPLHGPLGMNVQDFPPLHRRVVQQPVGGLGLRPAPAGQRDAPRRLRRQIVHQLDQPVGPPRIPQLQIVKLCLCPTHATTPQGYENLYHTMSWHLWVIGCGQADAAQGAQDQFGGGGGGRAAGLPRIEAGDLTLGFG